MNRVQIFDSTLRDGAQGEGIAFSVEDKLNIISALDRLGIDFAEAGNPGSNPKDVELFSRLSELKLSHLKPVAFGATRRKYTDVRDDANLAALIDAGTEYVAVFGKSSVLHVEKILGASKKENLAMIADTCRYLRDNGKRVIFDAEHFFDGYKLNPDYALKSLKTAVSAGAEIINLCDTNGGTFPYETDAIVTAVKKELPDIIIGIHNHNDNGCAVANTIAAVRAGAEHVQGTYLGFGERCGNTALSTVIPDLQLKCGFRCIPDENMHMLTSIAIEIAQICNISIKRNEPFIGRSAFAHKAGMHVDGVLKYHASFEHIDPDLIGNTRRILMSEMSGRTAVLRKIDKIARLDHSSPELAKILSELKRLEYIGYQFDGADGSFEMLVRKILGMFKSSFELISYKVLDELPYDNSHSATATIKIRVNDTVKISAADGDGPVNALDKALREALSAFYPKVASAHLIDYKVRVMEPKDATAAVVRVLITSTDGNEVWTTVGVSKDVIEASWLALVDSIEYTLVNRENKK